MSLEVGIITEVGGAVVIEWKIEYARLLLKKDYISYTSPVFPLSDSCWCLGVILSEDVMSNNCFNVFLRREDWGPAKSVNVTFGLGESDGSEKISGKTGSSTFSKNVSINSVFNLENSNFQWNTLIIICTLKSDTQHPISGALFKRLWNTSLNLGKILEERKNTDVVLTLKNRRITAHRVILESRFPNFAHNMNLQMEECPSGEISVDDGDEYAFDIVLSYAYTGEPKGLDPKNVWAVYRIALIYELHELRKLCTLFLATNLSVKGVCDVIAKAALYGEEELKVKSKEFFDNNSSKILVTKEWRTFKEENSALCVEILEYMMKKKTLT